MTQIDVEPPSKQQLLKTSGIAAGIAVVVLFVAILPAEYGVDPLRTGQLLGLTDEGAASVDAHHQAVDPITEYQVVVELPPQSGWMESGFKMWLDEGESFMYQWSSSAPVTVDLHTDGRGSYSGNPVEGGTDAEGFLTTPWSGYTGFAVRNDSDQPVTFSLRLIGEFDADQDLYGS